MQWIRMAGFVWRLKLLWNIFLLKRLRCLMQDNLTFGLRRRAGDCVLKGKCNISGQRGSKNWHFQGWNMSYHSAVCRHHDPPSSDPTEPSPSSKLTPTNLVAPSSKLTPPWWRDSIYFRCATHPGKPKCTHEFLSLTNECSCHFCFLL